MSELNSNCLFLSVFSLLRLIRGGKYTVDPLASPCVIPPLFPLYFPISTPFSSSQLPHSFPHHPIIIHTA